VCRVERPRMCWGYLKACRVDGCRLEFPPQVICLDRPINPWRHAQGPGIRIDAWGLLGLSMHTTWGGNSRRESAVPSKPKTYNQHNGSHLPNSTKQCHSDLCFPRKELLMTQRPAEAGDIMVAGVNGKRICITTFPRLSVFRCISCTWAVLL